MARAAPAAAGMARRRSRRGRGGRRRRQRRSATAAGGAAASGAGAERHARVGRLRTVPVRPHPPFFVGMDIGFQRRRFFFGGVVVARAWDAAGGRGRGGVGGTGSRALGTGRRNSYSKKVESPYYICPRQPAALPYGTPAAGDNRRWRPVHSLWELQPQTCRRCSTSAAPEAEPAGSEPRPDGAPLRVPAAPPRQFRVESTAPARAQRKTQQKRLFD